MNCITGVTLVKFRDIGSQSLPCFGHDRIPSGVFVREAQDCRHKIGRFAAIEAFLAPKRARLAEAERFERLADFVTVRINGAGA